MNCESARAQLSAYFDQEMEPDAAADLRAHLARCASCADRLAEFAELSALASDIGDLKVPQRVWTEIEASLSGRGQSSPINAKQPLSWEPSKVALAAMVLVGVSLALAGYWTWRSLDPHVQMAAIFDQYLGEFREHPQQAQEVLRVRYAGRPLNLQVANSGTFVPNAPQELPAGFARVETYELDMPCCKCTQTIYRNSAGDILALFEHTDDQRAWFGDRPVIDAQCHGQQTSLVQLNKQLAASWKSGRRNLTIIGAHDVEQVSELIAYLDAHRPPDEG
jgi:hypothetical protein